MHLPNFHINNQWILSKRGIKNGVDTNAPYAFIVENERLPNGKIEDVATIFLTNRECPFHCLMCDLWKNTTDKAVPIGSIPQQIEFALENLLAVKHIKLYNSGNFFDPKAIPVQDYQNIAAILSGFETVLVENHPRLMNHNLLDFQRLLRPELQVAVGLETVHREVLPRLNKQMTLENFRSSIQFLSGNDILSRAFILLRPPFLDEVEGIEWAKKSIDFAFECGVECCSVIPTRPGNGALEVLEETGYFHAPTISSLEKVLEYGISLQQGRVFADLWDLERFSACDDCFKRRRVRLDKMNLTQEVSAPLICSCH